MNQEAHDSYNQNGYTVVPALFSGDETAVLRDHFMALRAGGPYPGDYDGLNAPDDDPWKKYPRLIHSHRFDRISLQWLLDPRIAVCLRELLGTEPYAVQTMLYFKPPGARGQAMHQDQYYLRAEPGTCIAVWLALDDCDEENGCLQVVPGSQRLPVLCTHQADPKLSFTNTAVALPPASETVPIVMKAGDALFFHGSLIHGSDFNSSEHRFRRSLVGHYVTGDAEKVAEFYHPSYRFDGSIVELGTSLKGGSCGAFIDRDGIPVLEMVPVDSHAAAPSSAH